MSISRSDNRADTSWWERLGLQPSSIGVRIIPHGVGDRGVDVLREYEPMSFVSRTGNTEELSLEQLRARVAEAEKEHAREVAEAKALAGEQRCSLGWAKIGSAYASPDAGEVITDGGWAGFTQADATAWCWNLFQYEPHGFVYPGSELRVRAMTLLESGGLPETFGYPDRARALTELGLAPKEYRQYKEALFAPTFSSADVKHK